MKADQVWPDGTASSQAASALRVGVAAAAIDPNDRYLSTEHLRTNLKHRTISSGFVTVVSQGTKFALTLASTVILSRMLDPKDFGLLAMVTSLMSLLRIFKDAGLSTATVQSETITHAQVSNLFWINVGLGSLLAVLMAAGSPLIAWFNGEPRLTGIALWLSITFLLSCSTVQHQALLRRQMRFKAIAVIELGSMMAGLVTAVVMAKAGCGYWSLVGMNLSMEGTGFLLTWLLARWRPQLPRRDSGTRSLLRFGVHMMGGSACYIFARSADSVLVGWRYGADVVGLYSRALALLTRPLDQLLSPVGSVVVPALSRLQGDPVRYRRAFLQLYEGTALVSFALSGFLLALSRPITLFLLGSKWEGAAPIFAGFSLAAIFIPVGTTTAWLLISQANGKDYFRWNVISMFITVSSYLIGLTWGPIGVAVTYSLTGIFIALPSVFYLAGRSGPVTTKDLWLGVIRHFPLCVTVTGTAFLARFWASHYSPLVQLLIGGTAGLAACVATILLIKPQREIALHFFKLMNGMVKARLGSADKEESTLN
jgi:O-antigen/teichoic acid export membrane protein